MTRQEAARVLAIVSGGRGMSSEQAEVWYEAALWGADVDEATAVATELVANRDRVTPADFNRAIRDRHRPDRKQTDLPELPQAKADPEVVHESLAAAREALGSTHRQR